MIFRHTHI